MSKIKFNRKVLTLATVFALMLTALAFYGTTAGEVYAAGNDVTVTFQAESNDNTFFVKPKEVTVSPGYAATIKSTWTNSSATVGPNGVSALDVLAKIHHNKYGAAFDNNPTAYIRGSASYITGMFGQTNESLPSSGIMFGVNNVQPNDGIVHEWTWNGVTTYGYMTYAINQAKVENGDHVNYFFLKDSDYLDYYTYFTDNNGNPKYKINMRRNTSVNLKLKGYKYFEDGYKVSWPVYNISGVPIKYLNQGGDGYSATMGNTIVNAGSNTNRSFRFTAPSTPGTYYISASGTYAGKPIVPPCLEIKVR